MAWTCHGTSNTQMVNALAEAGIVKSQGVMDGMLAVDRGAFVPNKQWAYNDAPMPIGHAATISAPHMHGYCLELLAHKMAPGSRVLDVGHGSGYLTAVMAAMVFEPYLEQAQPPPASAGLVVGVEHIPELVAGSKAAVHTIPWAQRLVQVGALKLLQADGRMGYPDGAPYDAIHVGAAATEVPSALTDQLAPGGRLVVPVGPEGGSQHLVVVDKGEDGQLARQDVMGVMYVPLTSQQHQLTRV